MGFQAVAERCSTAHVSTGVRDFPTDSPIEDDFLPRANPAEMTGEWFVVQCYTQREKAFAEILCERGVQHYLPLLTINRRDKLTGRRRILRLPLFPGYLFARCRHDDDCYELVARKSHVFGILRVSDQAKLTSELQGVYLALDSGRQVDAYPHAAVGRRVRVISGPLRGVEGVVVHRDDRAQLVIHITMLGQAGVSLDIDAAEVEGV